MKIGHAWCAVRGSGGGILRDLYNLQRQVENIKAVKEASLFFKKKINL